MKHTRPFCDLSSNSFYVDANKCSFARNDFLGRSLQNYKKVEKNANYFISYAIRNTIQTYLIKYVYVSTRKIYRVYSPR